MVADAHGWTAEELRAVVDEYREDVPDSMRDVTARPGHSVSIRPA
ncbi:hypothetical protein ACFYP6_32840 [Streptomyces goshikiensis]